MNHWEWQLLEDKNPADRLKLGDAEVRVGDRVRLRPKKGGDIMDLALTGRIAIIESIEQDYEGKTHVCVILDDDPGRDLGFLRQPGHRFFFAADEMEPAPADAIPATSTRPALEFLSLGSATSFSGTMALALRWSAAFLCAPCRLTSGSWTLASAVWIWRTRYKTDMKPPFWSTPTPTANLRAPCP